MISRCPNCLQQGLCKSKGSLYSVFARLNKNEKRVLNSVRVNGCGFKQCEMYNMGPSAGWKVKDYIHHIQKECLFAPRSCAQQECGVLFQLANASEHY